MNCRKMEPAVQERDSCCVLLGKPGSGKGTLAALLPEFTGVPNPSSGAILREDILSGTQCLANIHPVMISICCK
jgi:adenylate kinase family enzyme